MPFPRVGVRESVFDYGTANPDSAQPGLVGPNAGIANSFGANEFRRIERGTAVAMRGSDLVVRRGETCDGPAALLAVEVVRGKP